MSDIRPTRSRPTLDPAHPLFALGYAPPVTPSTFLRLHDGGATLASGAIAQETPVALAYNGKPHVVMMCTPSDIEDFAVGFTRTEEIVSHASDIGVIRVARYSQGIEVEVTIPESSARALEGRGRSLVGRTGCGLCGVTTIDDALRAGTTVHGAGLFDRSSIFRAVEELPAFQVINEGTNAVHAAGWATRDGHVVLVREDVGRHNALDKLIGAMTRQEFDATGGFALVTSRASYELIQKCAVTGIALLAAISRPTALAIRMADAAGITLVAFVRGRTANVYTHAARLDITARASDVET